MFDWIEARTDLSIQDIVVILLMGFGQGLAIGLVLWVLIK